MLPKKSFLTQLFGTATKVRIFERLCLDPVPLSRHALSKSIANSIGPTYEQVDQLIALGALREVEGGITLDESFPFYDDILNIVTSTSHYMDQRILLNRIDSLFGNDYFITGYLAARQNGPPIDHDQDSVLVSILKLNNRSSNYLRTLSSVLLTRLEWHEIETIPDDITRHEIYGSTIWIASTERGLVDCVTYNDTTLYVVALLLLQNLKGGNLDAECLLRIAGNNGVLDFFIALLSRLNDAGEEELVSLEPKDVVEARGMLEQELISNIDDAAVKAFNTLMEG